MNVGITVTSILSEKVALDKASKDAKKASCEEYLGCLFILVADKSRFQGLKCALNNQYLMDKDSYPTSMPQDLKLLEKFKADNGTATKVTDMTMTLAWHLHKRKSGMHM